ncbi:MAG: class I SAM-dependent methyltransferase [archaeon]
MFGKNIRKIVGANRFWILPLLEGASFLTFKLNYFAHKLMYFVEWCPPEPTFVDRYSNLSYTWIKTRNPMWVERGVFNNLLIKKNGKVLDLACGDGFNTRNFYSLKAKEILAVDIDVGAISKAISKNSLNNITYKIMDLKKDFPHEKFDNIIMDAVLQHFSPKEIKMLFNKIKLALNTKGIFSGNAIAEVDCKDKKELESYLKTFFKHITIYETFYPDRHNLYFVASNYPFSKNNFFDYKLKK